MKLNAISRYILLISLKGNRQLIDTIKILDTKTDKLFCGSPIKSDHVSLKEYGSGILNDIKIPLDDEKFKKIKEESYLQLRNTRFIDLVKKYQLEEYSI
jgi:hypothetical protein